MRSQRGLVHNLGFLEIDFLPKYLCIFQETGDYLLCILVVLYHKSSVISKHELVYQNNSGFLNRFAPSLLCIHTPWVKSVNASDKTIEREIENSVGSRTKPCFALFPTSNGLKSSPLKLTDTFILVYEPDGATNKKSIWFL